MLMIKIFYRVLGSLVRIILHSAVMPKKARKRLTLRKNSGKKNTTIPPNANRSVESDTESVSTIIDVDAATSPRGSNVSLPQVSVPMNRSCTSESTEKPQKNKRKAILIENEEQDQNAQRLGSAPSTSVLLPSTFDPMNQPCSSRQADMYELNRCMLEAKQRRLRQMSDRARAVRAAESPQAKRTRLQPIADHARESRTLESESTRQLRLQKIAEHSRIARSNQDSAARQQRLQLMAARARQVRRQLGMRPSHLRAATETVPVLHDLGLMNKSCQFCNAMHFEKEKKRDSLFTECCGRGQIVLPELSEYPDLLQQLLKKRHQLSGNFMRHIRMFNSVMSFASIGVQIDYLLGRGRQCFRVQGQIYHWLSGDHASKAKYGQLYFLDTAEALNARTNLVNTTNQTDVCNPTLLGFLETMLRDINPFAHAYMFVRDVERLEQQRALISGQPPRPVTLQIIENRGTDLRR